MSEPLHEFPFLDLPTDLAVRCLTYLSLNDSGKLATVSTEFSDIVRVARKHAPKATFRKFRTTEGKFLEKYCSPKTFHALAILWGGWSGVLLNTVTKFQLITALDTAYLDKRIIPKLKYIRTLIYRRSGCSHFMDWGHLLVSSCPNLKLFSVSGSFSRDEIELLLGHLPLLKHLELQADYPNVFAAFRRQKSPLEQLRVLHLRGKQLRLPLWENIDCNQIVSIAPNLVELYLDHFPTDDLECVKCLQELRLTKLGVSIHLYVFETFGLRAFANRFQSSEFFPNLVYLNLYSKARDVRPVLQRLEAFRPGILAMEEMCFTTLF